MPEWFRKHRMQLFLGLVGVWLALDVVSYLVAESFWFQQVGYFSELWLRLQTRFWLWVVALGGSLGYLLVNLQLAHRLKYPHISVDADLDKMPGGVIAPIEATRVVTPASFKASSSQTISKTQLGLSWLLALVLALALVAGIVLIHYGQVFVTYWQSNGSILGIAPVRPLRLQPEVIWLLFQQFSSLTWQPLVLAGITLTLIVAPACLWAFSILLSLDFSFIISNNWAKVLQFFHATSFGSQEPLFHLDISFYVFILPILELLEFWLGGLFLFGLISVSLVYLLSGNSVSEGRFPGFSPAQQRHIHVLAGCWLFTIAASYFLNCFRLLYSTRGIAYGAGYTDTHAQLPSYILLGLFALFVAGYLLYQALILPPRPSPPQSRRFPFSKPVTLALVSYPVIVIVAALFIPIFVQRLVVQPNELVRERPYIQYNINFTRKAFDLANIEVETFDPEGQLSYDDIQANDLTINNIRLWDKRPLLETNRQLQQIRLYYKFPDADIDRYTLKKEQQRSGITNDRNNNQTQPNTAELANETNNSIPLNQPAGTTEKQQVLLAARELDYNAVPPQAQTWINEHLIYTHGYGYTMSPVNTVGPSGLPYYFVRDIGFGSESLRTSSPEIRASIPINNPRIYYGELTNTYVMAPTKVAELDYPSGDENVYNRYDGRGGVSIGNIWRRLLFAKYLKNWQMIFTQNFTPETKVLFRRSIKERVQAIAPFLQYDSDPYLVVARANLEQQTDSQTPDSYLYWILDAYTSSDRYPYSDPGGYPFNYIRNSVKVVIDAYNGSVAFYIADPDDPLIQSWNKVFPQQFKLLSEMPVTLRSHIRYPIDLFDIQSEQLLNYHMIDPQVFYNREDQWQVPREIYGTETQQVQPYYLIMRLPTAKSAEFIILHPFTPTSRNNLIAWLAGRSDGENYGKLLLYQFPKQRLVYGPEQIEARINQDPAISQQISLWNRQGSRAIQGNLLVIPIEQSLLYVEPLYLEAEQTSLPTLVRVIVAYENQIAMAETLEQALDVIFRGEETTTPVILSPGDEAIPPLTDPLLPQQNE